MERVHCDDASTFSAAEVHLFELSSAYKLTWVVVKDGEGVWTRDAEEGRQCGG